MGNFIEKKNIIPIVKAKKIFILHKNKYFTPVRDGGDSISLIGLTKGVLQTSPPKIL